jgi:2-polyprenyl-6-methoxyphenol hydroxylase-like FAD-dependent oxidoreductase
MFLIEMKAARGAGAVVEENHNVVSAGFSAVSKRWLIECENGRSFAATFLIAADGASSHISKMLGVITDPPNASGTRSYIRPEDTVRKGWRTNLNQKKIITFFQGIFQCGFGDSMLHRWTCCIGSRS